MEKVLIVEDSKVFARILIRKIEDELFFDACWASNFEEARYLIEENPDNHDYIVALLDLHLPDAADGRIVDYVIGKGIPSIVFTGDVDCAVRDRIWSKKVVDYVAKDSPDSLDYLCSLVRRVSLNKYIHVLVVDDSATVRRHLMRLLEAHEFIVHEAENGETALDAISRHPEIKVVIADYFMPGLDGVELTRRIRRLRRKDELAVIGISAYGNTILSARFIKNGANDFLNKPFSSEEFYCRVTQNLEMLEYIQKLRETAIRDPLTGLYNRRHFFEAAKTLHADLARGETPMTLAMIDIDFFKKVNDTYGHAAGDEVLKHVAQGLGNRFRGHDVAARLGGEEFCVLARGLSGQQAMAAFDDLRNSIERSKAKAGKSTIGVTVSIGICDKPHGSVDAMLAAADAALYKAKRTGRNRVLWAE
ncbi:diguanylate cyclase [Solidesulfovibrio carbinolicus]|uniref:diguanylate cyclase n=1 Tax=Solidesulfovibrio carbinolicus TaxID=296842 RepID=A0A4V0YR94_9BACT|nr:diguanylate cyclase [Solidesulfovibrio carbinolicus]QAZ69012.1 diguanylate cyclase response regulator [Solidesulfovibrio carbinolicus]